MSAFNKRKTLKNIRWIFFGTIFLILFFRAVFFFVINRAGQKIILKQVESPNKKNILTVYNVYPLLLVGGAGSTVFNLRPKNRELEFVHINLLTGKTIYPDGDVLIMDGDYSFPYGVVWLGDQDLLLNLIIPERNYKSENEYLKSEAYIMKEKWGNVNISYGILNSKVYRDEVRVLKEPMATQ